MAGAGMIGFGNDLSQKEATSLEEENGARYQGSNLTPSVSGISFTLSALPHCSCVAL
jgi:hypothetical protein